MHLRCLWAWWPCQIGMHRSEWRRCSSEACGPSLRITCWSSSPTLLHPGGRTRQRRCGICRSSQLLPLHPRQAMTLRDPRWRLAWCLRTLGRWECCPSCGSSRRSHRSSSDSGRWVCGWSSLSLCSLLSSLELHETHRSLPTSKPCHCVPPIAPSALQKCKARSWLKLWTSEQHQWLCLVTSFGSKVVPCISQ